MMSALRDLLRGAWISGRQIGLLVALLGLVTAVNSAVVFALKQVDGTPGQHAVAVNLPTSPGDNRR